MCAVERTPPGGRALERGECLEHLRQRRIGRAAFAAGGILTVVPTPFRLDGGFVSLPRARLEAAVGQVVTFQCDDFDEGRVGGWSVLLTGRAEAAENGEIRVAPTLLHGWLTANPDEADADAPQRAPLGARLS